NSLTVNPAAAVAFTIVAPGSVTAGTAFDVTVTARDAFGNVATGYNGRANLYSSDGQAVAPLFVNLTNGVGQVSVTLARTGLVRLPGAYSGPAGASGLTPTPPA